MAEQGVSAEQIVNYKGNPELALGAPKSGLVNVVDFSPVIQHWKDYTQASWTLQKGIIEQHQAKTLAALKQIAADKNFDFSKALVGQVPALKDEAQNFINWIATIKNPADILDSRTQVSQEYSQRLNELNSKLGESASQRVIAEHARESAITHPDIYGADYIEKNVIPYEQGTIDGNIQKPLGAPSPQINLNILADIAKVKSAIPSRQIITKDPKTGAEYYETVTDPQDIFDAALAEYQTGRDDRTGLSKQYAADKAFSNTTDEQRAYFGQKLDLGRPIQNGEEYYLALFSKAVPETQKQVYSALYLDKYKEQQSEADKEKDVRVYTDGVHLALTDPKYQGERVTNTVPGLKGELFESKYGLDPTLFKTVGIDGKIHAGANILKYVDPNNPDNNAFIVDYGLGAVDPKDRYEIVDPTEMIIRQAGKSGVTADAVSKILETANGNQNATYVGSNYAKYSGLPQYKTTVTTPTVNLQAENAEASGLNQGQGVPTQIKARPVVTHTVINHNAKNIEYKPTDKATFTVKGQVYNVTYKELVDKYGKEKVDAKIKDGSIKITD